MTERTAIRGSPAGWTRTIDVPEAPMRLLAILSAAGSLAIRGTEWVSTIVPGDPGMPESPG